MRGERREVRGGRLVTLNILREHESNIDDHLSMKE